MDETRVSVPLQVRLQFGHAAIQYVADEVGVDLLHIKGAAVDPTLRAGFFGTDVDVIVRPAQVAIMDRALRRAGWSLYSTFANGSPFGHAQTYLHPDWGYVDVHRRFPGIGVEAAAAFDALWEDRASVEIAGVRCAVPSVTAQRVLLILNAARSSNRGRRDVPSVWDGADGAARAEAEALVARLHAGVAFAAATGDLEQYRGDRAYLLWKVVSQGGPRSVEWWARIRAEPDLRERLRLIGRAPLVNVDHLAHRLGRRPSKREIGVEFVRRPVIALREAVRAARMRVRGSGASR
ncbi:nucleotidyltransferase family protein [Agromyces sp. GXS1127]|uniref:nucleotidyltransferase family protein n=1 Tax=Agromyces sp. GXS1127 TaxID=3424181 RepID=UPI003D30F9E7